MLTWRELEKLERIVHRRHFIADEEVLRAWVPRSGLFVVLSGSVDVVRPQEDGSQQVLDNLREGELLGEFAILDDSPRSTSIVAAEPSELVGFFRPDLMDLVQTDPRLGFKILYRVSQIMAKQLRDDIGYLRQIRSSLEMLGATKAQPV
jgi:CRP-like cAMP-binding protein